jgi:hypothetical protein
MGGEFVDCEPAGVAAGTGTVAPVTGGTTAGGTTAPASLGTTPLMSFFCLRPFVPRPEPGGRSDLAAPRPSALAGSQRGVRHYSVTALPIAW